MCSQISLQLGHLIVFELNQTLKLVELALQVGHTAFQLVVFTAAGVQAFLGHSQLVGQSLAVSCAFVTAGSGFATLSGNQFQAIACLDLGWRGSGAGAFGGIQLASTGRYATAFTPGSILLSDLGNGFTLGAALDLLLIRQTQHLATFQTVDVAANKGIRIQILNGQHGLMHTATRTCALGNFPKGVIGSGFVFIAIQRLGCWRSRGGRGSWSSRTSNRSRCDSWTRSGYRSLHTWCGGGNRQLCSRWDYALRGIERWIKQQGVFTQQTAIGPQHFNQEVQVGLAHGLAGSHPNDTFAIGFEHGCELEVRQEVLTINTSLGECFGGRQGWNDFVGSQVAHFQQLDLCDQRLIERRLQGHLTQPQRVRHTG